jgi:hypothetical protein
MDKLRHRIAGWLLPVALVLATTGVAHADRQRRRQGVELEPSSPGVAIMYSVVALVAVAAIAFKPSKRTHVD